MDGEPTSFTRLIWISLTVLVIVAAAWFGVAIAQHTLESPDTPTESEPESPGQD